MLLEIILAFLIGSIPTGYLLNKYFGHGDIRKVGSGNIGATNVLRHSGKLLGLLTLLIDIGKGFLALELLYGSGGRWTISILGASVVLGHIFSPWLKFKGGKGVATMLGVILFISSVGYWKLSENIFFITTFSWLMIVFFTRYVALGSVISLTIATIYSYFFIPSSFLFFVLMTLLITYRHKDNFERIRNKTEHKISF
ncbi:MAG: Glycerol-3-phosphate acyltransferase [Alphaproteobacteria bacterium MarineAlpha6_Bin5]|nr:MAG: Glycerol-3-phosphate acyltransferase [Alphaproteobacteria bacterium MarineAlpha6_Bin5]